MTGIPNYTKAQFENLSGFSFDDVRVHYNSNKPAQLQALAYTQGNQVHIAPGQEKHLSHELAHVVQQKEGRVRPTINLNGFAVNDNVSLENEADNYAAIQRKQVIAPNQDTIQTQSEKRSGFLFNDVRVHYNSNKPAQLQTPAYMQGYQVDVVQGVFLPTATIPPAVAPIADGRLIAHINATSSSVVKEILASPNVRLMITWDGTLLNPATTTMNLEWIKGVANFGPIDMFDDTSLNAFNKTDLKEVTTYTVIIRVKLQTPPVGTTWQGNLLHELEAHTKLAKKVMDNIGKSHDPYSKLKASLDARSMDKEHQMYAKGEGGTEDAMTKTVSGAATTQEKVDVLCDIGNDRAYQLNNSGALSRMDFNSAADKIRQWLSTMKSKLPGLTGGQAGLIDAVINRADLRRR